MEKIRRIFTISRETSSRCNETFIFLRERFEDFVVALSFCSLRNSFLRSTLAVSMSRISWITPKVWASKQRSQLLFSPKDSCWFDESMGIQNVFLLDIKCLKLLVNLKRNKSESNFIDNYKIKRDGNKIDL